MLGGQVYVRGYYALMIENDEICYFISCSHVRKCTSGLVHRKPLWASELYMVTFQGQVLTS